MSTGKLFPEFRRQHIGYIPSEGYLDDGEEFDLLIGESGKILAQFANEQVLPFEGHLNPVKVVIEACNLRSRESVAPGGKVHIYIRGFNAYGFSFADPVAALEKSKRVLEFFNRWPVITDWSPDKVMAEMKGRAVWYREQPAIVKQYVGPEGKVLLAPDEELIKGFRPEPWNSLALQMGGGSWEDLMAPEIHWFRE